MPSLKDILEAMNSSWPVALTALVAGFSILLGYHYELQYLSALPSWVPGTAFLAFALGGSILAVNIIRWVLAWITTLFRKRRAEQWKREHIAGIDDLPEAEAYLLVWAVANRTRVFTAPYFNPHTKALTAKGYLMIPPGNHRSDQMPYEIPDYIWGALKEQLAGQDLSGLVGQKLFQDSWY